MSRPSGIQNRKIESITVYRLELPLDYVYRFSSGRTLSQIDSTIVAITTHDGITGWGEACPCGNNYLPNFPAGIRAGIDVIAQALIGENPLHVQKIYQRMNQALAGHAYAKAAIDLACWDLLGKTTGLGVCELLGGDFGEPAPIVAGVPAQSPEESLERIDAFRAWGCRIFSCKMKGEPAADLIRLRAILARARPGEHYICDANGGFSTLGAIELVRGLIEFNIVIEQPCVSIDECQAVREATGCRMILDEPINSVGDVIHAARQRTADVLNLKTTRLGGISPLRQLRDLAIYFNIPVTIQDAGGTDITRSAIAHLIRSTPPKYRHSAYDPYDWHSLFLSPGQGAIVEDGCMRPLELPGLGVEPDLGILGTPVAVYGG